MSVAPRRPRRRRALGTELGRARRPRSRLSPRRRRGGRRGRPRLGGGRARRARVPRSRAARSQAREADVVVLASPPSTHRPLVGARARRGLPRDRRRSRSRSTSPTRVRSRHAAAAAGRHAMVAQNYRFRRQSRALRDLVQGGALGRAARGPDLVPPRPARARISRATGAGQMPHPYLLDMAIHHVDMLRMITGQEVVEVDARGWRARTRPFKHDPTVGGPAHARRRHAGRLRGHVGRAALGDVVERRLGAPRRRAGRATWSGGVDDALRGEPCGSRGTASGPRASRCRRCGRSTGSASSPSSAAPSPPASRPRSSVADNVKSLGTILAIARSTEERRPVRVEEILAA